MMKRILISGLLILCGIAAEAQSPFRDAQKIIELSSVSVDGGKAKIAMTDNDKLPSMLELMQAYYPEKLNDLTDDSKLSLVNQRLKSAWSSSHFMSFNGKTEATDPTVKLNPQEAVNAFLANAQGLDVTNIADGLAKFLVKRTKEELNVAFFSKFRDELNQQKELQILFPETHQMLMVIGEQIYNHTVYINALRTAFESDLSAILLNIQELVDSDALQVLQGKPVLKAMISEGIVIFDAFRKGVHPGDVLDQMADRSEAGGNYEAFNDNVPTTIQLTNFISQSLRSEGDRYWMESSAISAQLKAKNQAFMFLYLGLLYRSIEMESPNLAFISDPATGTEEKVLDWVKDRKDDYDELERFISDVSQTVEQIDLTVKELRSMTEEGKLTYAQFSSLYNEFNGLVALSTELSALPGLDFLDATEIQDQIDRVASISELVNEISMALKDEEYTSAVLKTSQLLDEVFVRDNEHKTRFIKYAGFMASMVEAENSDEVSAIIESFALPQGSYRIKRYSNNSIALQSYVGFIGGAEALWNNGGMTNTAFTYSLFAPVGIQFSRGSWVARKGRCEERKGSSNGILLSAIDIGAVTAFRFNPDNDTVNTIPNVKLGQILAPGVFYTHGFARVPVSWGLGVQAVPQLREVATSGNVFTEDAFRAVGFIAVDIALLSLHVKEAQDRRRRPSCEKSFVKHDTDKRCN